MIFFPQPLQLGHRGQRRHILRDRLPSQRQRLEAVGHQVHHQQLRSGQGHTGNGPDPNLAS